MFVITTSKGGPLYFRDTREAAETLRRAWQDEIASDPTSGLYGAKVEVSYDPDEGEPDYAAGRHEVRREYIATCLCCTAEVPTFDGDGPLDCPRCSEYVSAWQVEPARMGWFSYFHSGLGRDQCYTDLAGPFATEAEARADLGEMAPATVTPPDEADEEEWTLLREGFAFLENECDVGEEAEATLERMRRAFERLADRFEVDA